MERASPVELRKALEVSQTLAKAGIDFVPIPVLGKEHKVRLQKHLEGVLAKMEEGAEQ